MKLAIPAIAPIEPILPKPVETLSTTKTTLFNPSNKSLTKLELILLVTKDFIFSLRVFHLPAILSRYIAFSRSAEPTVNPSLYSCWNCFTLPQPLINALNTED